MYRFVALLFIAGTLVAQDRALVHLKEELAAARIQSKNDEKAGAARIAKVHGALRDWIESRLPRDVYSLAGEISRLQVSVAKELVDAGLSGVGSQGDDSVLIDPGFDQVDINLQLMPEMPDTLFVTAGVGVSCGHDEAIYVYRFDSSGRSRVIEDHPKSDWGYGYAELELSNPDLQGRRLLLVNRLSVQCASMWMETTYSVYRLNHSPQRLLLEQHGIYLGNKDGVLFVLKPDELIIEFLDRSIDASGHNRTNILRYSLQDGATRIEPVAFQPQDYVEEWLTRSWDEVSSRSAPATQKWHDKFRTDFLGGEYSKVVPCVLKRDRWSIGFDITYIGDKQLASPLPVFFLVHDLGNYRYAMEAVGDSDFEGCPGASAASDKHPWLSREELKKLP